MFPDSQQGTAVSFAGNMHYVIYARIVPFIEQLTGKEVEGYWFPDATRYIGYNPYREEDRTIHEFPAIPSYWEIFMPMW